MNIRVKNLFSSERIGLGVLVSVFICLSMIASGVGIRAAVLLTLIVALQTGGGIAVWDWISYEERRNPIESISMGAAIGFIFSTLLDQLFLHTPLHQIAWFLPTLMTVAYFLIRRSSYEIKKSDHDGWPSSWYALFIFAFSLLAYSPIEKYQLIGAIFLLGCVEVLRRSSIEMEKSQYQQFWFPLVGVVASALLMFLLARRISTSSLFYRQLFIGTDDILMNEQRASSIALWGIADHSAATGIPMKYHWLSLAWSGMTSRIADAQPFSATGLACAQIRPFAH